MAIKWHTCCNGRSPPTWPPRNWGNCLGPGGAKTHWQKPDGMPRLSRLPGNVSNAISNVRRRSWNLLCEMGNVLCDLTQRASLHLMHREGQPWTTPSYAANGSRLLGGSPAAVLFCQNTIKRVHSQGGRPPCISAQPEIVVQKSTVFFCVFTTNKNSWCRRKYWAP